MINWRLVESTWMLVEMSIYKNWPTYPIDQSSLASQSIVISTNVSNLIFINIWSSLLSFFYSRLSPIRQDLSTSTIPFSKVLLFILGHIHLIHLIRLSCIFQTKSVRFLTHWSIFPLRETLGSFAFNSQKSEWPKSMFVNPFLTERFVNNEAGLQWGEKIVSCTSRKSILGCSVQALWIKIA